MNLFNVAHKHWIIINFLFQSQNFKIVLRDQSHQNTFNENENSWKSVAISVSVHIRNAQTKDAQHMWMVKSVHKGR